MRREDKSREFRVTPNCQRLFQRFGIRSNGLSNPFRTIDLFTVYDAILAGGANTPKITVNVWDFGPLGPAFTPLQRGRFPQQRFILKDICTEIIFVKYKEEIQVITTANEFLRFHTNPSYQHNANYNETRSHMGRFIIRIYAGAPNEYNICSEKQKLPRIFYTLKKTRNF